MFLSGRKYEHSNILRKTVKIRWLLLKVWRAISLILKAEWATGTIII